MTMVLKLIPDWPLCKRLMAALLICFDAVIFAKDIDDCGPASPPEALDRKDKAFDILVSAASAKK